MRPDGGGDPGLWIAAAEEHLIATRAEVNPVRVRCFHAQRAVELSLKALLLRAGLDVPKVHTLERLALLLPGELPDFVREAAGLTSYAVEEMYPDTFSELGVDHAAEAVHLADAVVSWAASIVRAGA